MPADNSKLSAVLEEALNDIDGTVTVGEVIDRVADRGFGVVLILIALPTMIPILPPGASAVVGILFSILGAQLLFGAERPWMPKWVRNYKLSQKIINGLKTKGIRWIRKVERISRERLPSMRSKLVLRLVGLIMIGIGIVLFLPLPFLNTVPGILMLVLGIGFANRDGAFILVGAILSVAIIVVAVFFGYVFVDLYQWLRGRVLGRT